MCACASAFLRVPVRATHAPYTHPLAQQECVIVVVCAEHHSITTSGLSFSLGDNDFGFPPECVTFIIRRRYCDTHLSAHLSARCRDAGDGSCNHLRGHVGIREMADTFTVIMLFLIHVFSFYFMYIF